MTVLASGLTGKRDLCVAPINGIFNLDLHVVMAVFGHCASISGLVNAELKVYVLKLESAFKLEIDQVSKCGLWCSLFTLVQIL